MGDESEDVVVVDRGWGRGMWERKEIRKAYEWQNARKAEARSKQM